MSQPKTESPPWVHALAPYVPGKPIEDLERELGITDIIKLASNENPHGPSPKAIEAMAAAARGVSIYPDPGAFKLKAALAEKLGVPVGRVLVSNGSNELITLLVRAFATPEQNVVASQYGFVAYKVVSGAAGVEFREVPALGLDADIDGIIAACDADTRIVFLANPNNPTGQYTARADVERLLAEVPEHVLVVLDEAYVEYVTADACPDGLTLLGQRDNLVLLRTFSKAYALAGCRVGYAVAPEYVVERVNRIREPFNVNLLGQAGARAAVADEGHLARCVSANTEVRAALYAGLDALGVEYWPSETNFVLMRSPSDAAAVNEALLRRGIIVRPMGAYGLGDCLRVTVGTAAQNDRFLAALRGVMEEGA